MQRTRYGSIHFLFSIRKMGNFSRTLYHRQLIQFARIPVEFVARFIRFYQNCVKVVTFSMAAKYLLLISSYSFFLLFFFIFIFVQLMFTRSQSTMFRAVHNVHFITVSLR